ncbi:restriction endonuclease subunit S [Aquibacillus koreensis]|uniref:Restriction endonuclease subunit S n=1 Tax=Aquibacillus koreensis TaxID=279446 RepID=A0A9X4AIF4_9BACI|nr:restriction endonuclease subunit S [Aquibacillus koreensis]MCT2536846.1 restriction endonuclease subunit S [Aquibacillus koreensis]MDC3419335.1 restriction endonuclease subunit S [Aquibacillus koreensis]
MEKYGRYKEANLNWINRVPEHWDVVPNVALFEERSEKGFEYLPLLAVTIKRGVITQKELLEESVKRDSSNEDKTSYKHVCKGDLAYNKMRMWQGAIGVSSYEGIVSPAYIILKPKINIHPKYYHYLFRTSVYAKVSYQNSYGIHDDQLNLRFEDFKRMKSLLPPLVEQQKIVQYLDEKQSEVEKLIKIKNEKVDKLIELKATIIEKYIFGLENEGNTKSGPITGIKSIPSHWEVKRGKYYFKEIDKRSVTGKEELLSVSHINGVVPRSEKKINMFMAESYVGSKLCVPHDIVSNIMWAWAGGIGVSSHSGIVSPSYAVYRMKEDCLFYREYLDMLLRSRAYIAEYNVRSTGIHKSRLRLYSNEFFDIPFIRPPYKDQVEIVNFISEKLAHINILIDSVNNEIAKVKEYFDALVLNMVTGRHKVSEEKGYGQNGN